MTHVSMVERSVCRHRRSTGRRETRPYDDDTAARYSLTGHTSSHMAYINGATTLPARPKKRQWIHVLRDDPDTDVDSNQKRRSELISKTRGSGECGYMYWIMRIHDRMANYHATEIGDSICITESVPDLATFSDVVIPCELLCEVAKYSTFNTLGVLRQLCKSTRHLAHEEEFVRSIGSGIADKDWKGPSRALVASAGSLRLLSGSIPLTKRFQARGGKLKGSDMADLVLLRFGSWEAYTRCVDSRAVRGIFGRRFGLSFGDV